MVRIRIIYFMLFVFFLTACGGSKKTVKTDAESKKTEVAVKNPKEEKTDQQERDTIAVREEKLVETPEAPVPKEKFFVIIGGFRVPENVAKYEKEIRSEGFSPFILRNTEGLYRVAVFSYDDEQKAREKIRTIKKAFPQHEDTWLLIKVE